MALVEHDRLRADSMAFSDVTAGPGAQSVNAKGLELAAGGCRRAGTRIRDSALSAASEAHSRATSTATFVVTRVGRSAIVRVTRRCGRRCLASMAIRPTVSMRRRRASTASLSLNGGHRGDRSG